MAMNKDFGPFELKEKIGSGGMASVYLAVQKSLQRPVVLKILYPHLAEDEKLVQRFEREARAAAMLRHENIIQVIDCGRHARGTARSPAGSPKTVAAASHSCSASSRRSSTSTLG